MTLKRVMVVAVGLLAASALFLLALPAGAQSYTVLHPFKAAGRDPRGLVQASDGNFYGTTSRGGANSLGSVFKITPAGTLTTLYSFSGSDGQTPYGTLVQGTDGNFYGTTSSGGAGGNGTVFKVTPAGTLTTLYPFSGSDGSFPYGGLVRGTDGSFYGTTNSGGTDDFGTVFKLTPAGTLTTLHSFSGSDGQGPQGTLVQGADGSLYGTTWGGGTSGLYGTVFKITLAGTLTTLHSFGITDFDGAYPQAGLVRGSDGNFYGTTGGGSTVFKITPAGELTTLYRFGGSDGYFPYGGLAQGTDGNLYGTTDAGGTNDKGTVFKLTPAGALTTLHSFASTDGSTPDSSLVQGADGNFYGTTIYGGASDSGTVFKITPAGALTTLYSFTYSDGGFPYAGLVQGTDGNFYGTTASGSTGRVDTVFKITPTGALTTLYAFASTDGSTPDASLVQGADGNFYGTTIYGGASDSGTVFKITPAGALTTLYSFAGSDGQYPSAGLVQGTDGNFYGTTYYGGTTYVVGGSSGSGTVFRITAAGTLTTLYSFAYSDGAYPYAALVQGTDGNFYGTTSRGGSSSLGTVFKITPAGALSVLHSFMGTDGREPQGNLVQGADGNFYGTTLHGGAGYGTGSYPWGNDGTVFKTTPAGQLTTLHSFVGGGRNPVGLVQGSDGNFYGMTTFGGTSGVGTLFRITPTGVLVTLRSFSEGDGANPYAALVQGTDGNFYGTTSHNGPLGGGVIFRLTLGPGPSPMVTGVSPASGPVSGGTVVAISGTEFQPGAAVSFGGTAASGVTYLSATTIHALTPVHAAGAVAVTVTNPDLQPGSRSSAYTYACPWTPTAFNEGPCCVGGTISLSTPTVSGATYAWTGPNDFTSALQNPTIPADTTAATGSYSVTVTVAGCTSAPGATLVAVNPVPTAPPVTAPSIVGAGSPNRTASVPLHAGSTYSWTIGNGTITSGQGTSQITFTGGTAGTPLTLSVTETNTSGCASAPGNVTVTVAPAGSAIPFYTLPPCRVLDTRNQTGPRGGPPLQPGATRMFDVAASSCGIPGDAVAISANMTVTNVGAQGELVVFPSDILKPNTYAICFRAGVTRANNAIISFSKTSATFSVFDSSAAPVDFILDVNGFFR